MADLRPPHLRTWKDGWRHLSFLLIYSPKWLFFYPGLFLLTFGIFTAFALLPGAVKVGHVTFDIHTFTVASIAVLIGIQAMSFGTVAFRFATVHRAAASITALFGRSHCANTKPDTDLLRRRCALRVDRCNLVCRCNGCRPASVRLNILHCCGSLFSR